MTKETPENDSQDYDYYGQKMSKSWLQRLYRAKSKKPLAVTGGTAIAFGAMGTSLAGLYGVFSPIVPHIGNNYYLLVGISGTTAALHGVVGLEALTTGYNWLKEKLNSRIAARTILAAGAGVIGFGEWNLASMGIQTLRENKVSPAHLSYDAFAQRVRAISDKDFEATFVEPVRETISSNIVNSYLEEYTMPDGYKYTARVPVKITIDELLETLKEDRFYPRIKTGKSVERKINYRAENIVSQRISQIKAELEERGINFSNTTDSPDINSSVLNAKRAEAYRFLAYKFVPDRLEILSKNDPKLDQMGHLKHFYGGVLDEALHRLSVKLQIPLGPNSNDLLDAVYINNALQRTMERKMSRLSPGYALELHLSRSKDYQKLIKSIQDIQKEDPIRFLRAYQKANEKKD